MSLLNKFPSLSLRARFALLFACLALFSGSALATVADTPLYLVQAVKPDVMLTMSNDHQLYYKAYDDYSDLDKDGIADTTYKNSIDYYGYFDSYKCYTYDTTNHRFSPSSTTTTKYCSGDWSGNFLNWATMSRIDIVRKILYGGYRSTDTASLTVLERSFLPNDAHSFAKYYAGSDLDKLTPFNSYSSITMCNTTVSSSSTAYSQNVTDPPLMRVVAGNFSLWAANERWQCRWAEEKSAANSNDAALSGINAAPSNPYRDSGDINGDGVNPDAIGEKDYYVRVTACDTSLIGKEECKRYPDGNYKPVGLLQEYGDSGDINFGLMSGSYSKSKSGGVLRKNVGVMTDEVNVDTNGTFKAAPAAGGIINTISKFRLYGYYYGDGTYNKTSPGDNCSWGLNTFSNGQCSNWGNPQSEIYLEALRYFAGKSANSSFNCDDSSRISGLKTATWSDPLPPAKVDDVWCTPLSIIDFNASSSSYDNDELGSSSDIGLASVETETNKIGDAENITGNSYFVGKNGTDNNGLCTGKTVTALGSASGTCPDSPRLDGSYNIAGLAGYAHTNSIRSDLKNDQKVTTYGVALSPAVPKLELAVPGSTTGQKVTILPACQDTWNSNTSTPGNCTIVDFKIVTPYTLNGAGDTAIGKVYVNWEDSEQGGDYDQDMWGTLEYSITGTKVTVTTQVHAQSTPYRMAFGYVIGGTTKDGFHAHSGINNYNYTDSYSGVAQCSNCQSSDAATSQTYDLGSSLAGSLQQPLWYAAKWGGFTEDKNNANNQPDLVSEWDANGDGTPDKYYAATNPSDLYTSLGAVFKAVADTKSSFSSVAANSVTLSTNTAIYQAMFDSSNWTGNLYAYPINQNGVVQPEAWNAASSVDAANYSTGRTIFTYDPTASSGAGAGTAFRWSSLNTAQQALLNVDPVTLTTDTKGADRLNYIRGDVSNELAKGTGTFRDRDSRLGDIVNSTPAYVDAIPAFNYPDDFIDSTATDATTFYSTFKSTIRALNSGTGRIPMVYVGANDGMLHGFRADTGEELIAYVPNAAIATLPELTKITYTHKYYVDGVPTAGDAYGNFKLCTTEPCWRSVLIGSMAAGGKAVFALDVTDPSDFSESTPTNRVLWEKSSASTNFGDLGYTFSRPSIAHMANGKFAVIFGNGYESASGKAVLYILDAATGAQMISPIVLDSTGGNGLSTVAPVDKDGNGTVDYLYAGDLKGNVWKIDVTGSNTAQWKSSFTASGKPAPLFIAKDATGAVQPITSPLEVGLHSSGNGYMIYFGTGKYFAVGDNNPAGAQVQTMYGIWDKDDGTFGFTRAAGDLLKQEVVAEFYNQNYSGSAYDVRQTTNYSINWRITGATTPNYMGWYLDLIDPDKKYPGERVIDAPILDGGRLIFTTIIPSLKACDYGGLSWLMELIADSGSRLDETPPWDLNHDGLFNNDDYIQVDGHKVPPSGKRNSSIGMARKPLIIRAGKKEYKYHSGTKDATIEMTVESVGAGGTGRTSWRQLR